MRPLSQAYCAERCSPAPDHVSVTRDRMWRYRVAVTQGASPKKPTRRAILSSGVAALTFTSSTCVELVHGEPPWAPYSGSRRQPVGTGPWHFFTLDEGAAVEALVDRLIPPDPDTPGGKDAGCAVFIDRQLAGPYGSSTALYMRPPFRDGTKNQGNQSPQTPEMRYRLRKNFRAHTLCEVTSINLDRSGKVATGVTFVDSSGMEWEQPADLVLLCGLQIFNVQLLLLSGIGAPYDPQSGSRQG